MKNCTDCTHATWQRTAANRLHPSGDGMCGHGYKVAPLPQSMWWCSRQPPKPNGGAINRRNELADHCVYWARVA